MSKTAYSQPVVAAQMADVSQPSAVTQPSAVSHMSDARRNAAGSLASGGPGARTWGHRATWLAAGLALGLLGAIWLGPRLPWRTSSQATGQVVTEATAADCADTAMTYTLHKSRETARAAFHCMSGFVVRGVTEDDFIQDAERYPTPIAGDIRRVGEFDAPDGQRMVYFAVVGPSQTVSYTIYMDKDGKVWRIG